MTDDEHTATAMLLGHEPVKVNGRRIYRIRVGPAQINGCALYAYVDAETNELIASARSELDKPLVQ